MTDQQGSHQARTSIESAESGAAATIPRTQAKAEGASSVQELMENVRALGRNKKKPPSWTQIRSALQVQPDLHVPRNAIGQIARYIPELDSTWTVTLKLVAENYSAQSSKGRNQFLQHLCDELIAQAQDETDYPQATLPEQRSQEVRKWFQAITQREAISVPPAAKLLVALTRDGKTFAFDSDLVMTLLELAGQQQAARHETQSLLDIAQCLLLNNRDLQYVLSLLRRVRQSEHEARRQQRQAQQQLDNAWAQTRMARHERDELKEQLREAREDASRLERQLAERAADLARAQELLVVREREARIESAGEIARLRHEVARVVAYEVGEIRRYLDRTNPNIRAALDRLQRLEEFVTQLEVGRR